MKTYRVHDGAPQDVRVALGAHSDFMQDLLFLRGIETQEAAAQFLYPDFERDTHDPMLLPDMEKAVDRVISALKNNEKVSVWSDYDCDGIPGGVMLTDFLRKIGLMVRHYIPHRHKEGYGLNISGIDELAGEGITLIITIDLGTTEHEAITYAKSKGVDVIVTDHHLVHAAEEELVGENGLEGLGRKYPLTYSAALGAEAARGPFRKQVLPEDAFAVINPKRLDSKYPFDSLCGAGVAWKLVQGILQKNRFNLPLGAEKWYLDLVGIATLSDMVPLVGENRMLASFGLVVLRKNRRPGLAQLLSLVRIKPQTLTEDDIGFMIGPRINAASRMDSPDVAAKLLASHDLGEALVLAQKLNGINDERKSVVSVTVKEANKRLQNVEEWMESPIIVMGNPNWRPGILGLVANSLMQASGKPVFLWGRDYGSAPEEREGLLRGSCRSNGKVNVVELMQVAGDVFDHFGGHAASGGFSVSEGRVHELGPRLAAAYAQLPVQIPIEEVLIDRHLDMQDVLRAHKELKALAPFGVGNTKPLFLLQNMSIKSVRTFGKGKDHLELTCEREGNSIAGVSFFSTVDSYQKRVKSGDTADVVGHVETDWKGQPRLRIVDIL